VLVIFETEYHFIPGQCGPCSSYLCFPVGWEDRHAPISRTIGLDRSLELFT
jgi:hypothetical protein